jgi:lipopolysaccharide export system protein LptC
VNLIHETGTRFVTQRAHVNVSTNTAEGHDPVVGHGPSGDITAQGFRILDKGDIIIFTGKSNLLLKGTKPNASPAKPAALPADIAAAAAQIEAAAVSAGGAPEPPTATDVLAEPAPAAPAANPDAAAKSPGGGASRSGVKARRNAS